MILEFHECCCFLFLAATRSFLRASFFSVLTRPSSSLRSCIAFRMNRAPAPIKIASVAISASDNGRYRRKRIPKRMRKIEPTPSRIARIMVSAASRTRVSRAVRFLHSRGWVQSFHLGPRNDFPRILLADFLFRVKDSVDNDQAEFSCSLAGLCRDRGRR